ncbi:MAG: hypothetical protein K8T91_20065, partial [Planctomycetes bacterium]|nr:hypothetical protein [Planctomycetota bacterium]
MKRQTLKPVWAIDWPADSLQGRYLSEIRPDLIAKSQLAIAHACDAAVNHLSTFTDGPTLAASVDNPLVERFVAWLANKRFTERTAIVKGERVRYVVRRLGLEGCPSMRTPSKRPPNPTPGTIWHFFETHYRPQRMLDAKPISIEQYRICFNRLERQHGRELLIGELTSEVITNHLAWALEFNAMAPASVNSIRRKLLAIAREAYAVKLLADLPR